MNKLIGNNNENKYEIGNFSEELNRKAEKIVVRKEVDKKTELSENNFDIDRSAYIMIPGKPFLVSINEINQGLDYFSAHIETLKQGLAIPTIKEFMQFHNFFHSKYKHNGWVVDANGKPLSQKTMDDIYHQLTENCFTWLNGEFDIRNKQIEYVTKLDSAGKLSVKKENLEDYLAGINYINFKELNKQGIPNINSKSNHLQYQKGENILFEAPNNKNITCFLSNKYVVELNCRVTRSDLVPKGGVRAIKYIIEKEW